MKVKELCDGYRTLVTEAQKQDYLKKNIKVKAYIPYAQKVEMAKTIVLASNVDKSGEVRLDSPKQYLLNVYELLSTYTDLEVKAKTWASEFDDLNQLGLITRIIQMIPETEQAEFEVLRNMVYGDFMENYASMRSWLGRKFTQVKQGLEAWLDKASEKLSQVDWDALQKKLEEMKPNK